MTRILPCLLALVVAVSAEGSPEPVNGLVWWVHVPEVFASVGPHEFRATLRNAGKARLRYTAAGERPPVMLVLTADGGKPVRKRLPKQAQVHIGRASLVQGQPALSIKTDLRRAFGALAPGKYTLRLVHAAKGYTTSHPGFRPVAIASPPVRFEVVKTSLEAARKQSPPTPGFEFTVGKKKEGYLGVFVNRTKEPVAIWAYGEQPGRPLSTTAMAESWTGRGWDRMQGGFCGTGLRRVTIAPGDRKEISLPMHRAGIVRFTLSVFRGKKERQVASVPVLVE